ncbi:MAG: flavin reductase [Actinobacteria bacterium]|nr:flavin reductase [Actinomycetota bacterium]
MTDDPGSHAFDELVRRFNSPLLVVTTCDGHERAGCVVGFHGQCSISPPRYSIWLSRANRTYRIAMFAEYVAIHALGLDDRDIAALFGGTTGDDLDKFAYCAWTSGPSGVPLVDRLPNRMIGRPVAFLDDRAADHVCAVIAPERVSLSASRLRPMYLTDANDVEPGHEAEEGAV